MRRLALFAAIICALSGGSVACAAKCGMFLDPSIRFRENAVVRSEVQPLPDPSWLHEEGEIGGHNYTLKYNEGNFDIANFEVICGIDPIRDYRWCVADAGDLHISKAAGYGISVHVGRDHYPRTSVVLRPDKGPVFTSSAPGWEDKSAEALLAKLRKARTLTTRFQKWPYPNNLDNTMPIDALPAVLSYFRFALAQKTIPCDK